MSTRPVRIFLAMKDSSLPKAIKQVLPLVGNESSHFYVESVDEADLVIFTEIRDVEKSYNKEKSYAFLKTTNGLNFSLPANCITIDVMKILVGLVEAINEARKRLTPITDSPIVSEREVSLLPNALRILVIDDMPENIMSAKIGLTGHRLTTVTGYEDAMNILGKEKFDVVLTDLHLPMSSKTMGSNFQLGKLVEYGMLLMVEAAHQGAKYVAVVTDLNHHADPFSAAFDHFSGFSVKIDNAKVLMMHAPMKDGAKDWATALDSLIKE